jgi:hypothetical protein
MAEIKWESPADFPRNVHQAGRDGFWLARWLRAQGIEAYVIHPNSIAVSREQPPLLSYGASLPVDWRGGEAGERCWIVDRRH